jgi:uncharacterized Ntn-hydrolase superfamily protein
VVTHQGESSGASSRPDGGQGQATAAPAPGGQRSSSGSIGRKQIAYPRTASVTSVTYSIVARDPTTGALGVAAQSHWLAVGATVTWAQAGVGVVATQSYTDPAYGPAGLALLEIGRAPADALEALLSIDPHAERRQVAILGHRGSVAVRTGKRCIPEAGHRTGEGVAAQANMMRDDSVWDAMVEAYLATDAPLAERLVAALEAAQAMGGDVRGAQSASLLITQPPQADPTWPDVSMDLRVDDHDAPTAELGRLVRLHRAYDQLRRGRTALEAGDAEEALASYRRAADTAPGNEEIAFWYAVALMRTGALGRAAEVLREGTDREPGWRDLLERLPITDLLSSDEVERLAAALD